MPKAGLDAAIVTSAAAAVADEIGLTQLNMNGVAARLGVRAPSLYKHVDGLRDLTYRIAVLAATELGNEFREVMQGRAGRDALEAAARALREYAKRHPARYAAMTQVRPISVSDPLATALTRTLESFSAVLRGYRLKDPTDRVHALRMLRSMLQGFVDLEIADSFRLETDVNESFTWTVSFIDQGLRALERQ